VNDAGRFVGVAMAIERTTIRRGHRVMTRQDETLTHKYLIL
jgi:hypothetical protein